MLLMALHTNIQYGFTQHTALNNKSFNNSSNDTMNGDTDLNLRDAILRIKETFKVDILFDDAAVSGMAVSSKAAWSKALNAEEAFTKLLKDFQLKFRKVKKATYVIFVANASSKQIKKQMYKILNTEGTWQQDSEQDKSEIAKKATVPDKNVEAVPVNGVVVNEDDKPLSGVSITVKGTQKGTTTNNNGRFAINLENENDVLIFTYVGHESQEYVVSSTTANLKIVLRSLGKALSDVVVIGYGTQTRRDVTGSVSSISGQALERVPVNNLQQLMQGRAAGVQVQQTGGDLSGRFNIMIRGINSTSENGPLYVVDGVPLATGSFSTINPSDIASIDILKDASATAVYGARASNGVVVITTKSGKSGRTNINLLAKYGVEKDTKRLDMMNTAQFLDFAEQAYINNKQSWPGIQRELANNDNDWQDLMLRKGIWKELDLSVNGGNEKTAFAISGSYIDRKGILIGTYLNRASFRANIDHKVNSKLNVGVRLTNTFQWQNNSVDDDIFPRGFRQATFSHPWNPYKDENGNFTGIPSRSAPTDGPQENRVAVLLEEVREEKINRLLGNAFADYEILNSLKIRLNFGVDLVNGNNYTYLPVYARRAYVREQGSVSQSNSSALNYVTDLTLTYAKTFDLHKFNGLLGFSSQKFINESFGVSANGTTNNNLNQISNQPIITSGSGSETHAGLVSAFGRLNYAYNDRYLMTATVRRDGSSRFGPNNKFGIFPSASIAWRISEESFMKGIHWADDMKIRASYGLTGNQSIGNFQYLATTASANYVFGNTQVGGIRPNGFRNENIQWEANKQFDIGFDLSLFTGRFSISADYYNKRSENLLIVVPKPPSTGIIANPTVNLGSISNKGFEFAFTSRNLVQQLKWSTSFNISTNKNRVLDIGKNSLGQGAQIPGYSVPGFLGGTPINLTTAGHPIGVFYTHQWEGIWQIDNKAQAEKFGLEPGDSKYVDLNGDGAITLDDRLFAGQPMPRFFGGMDNTFSYKNITLSVFLNWQYGNKMFNQIRQLIESGQPAVNALNVPYWSPQNPTNLYPRPLIGGRAFGENSRPSTRFLEDASFMRVKNVSLSYDLPNQISQKAGFYSARLAFNITNLLTITKYSGFDPESSSGGILSGGLDLTPYPLARTYMFTLNLGF